MLLVLLFAVATAASTQHNVGEISSSHLSQRMDKLERLLKEQDSKLTTQQTLLRQQEVRLSQQKILLHQQDVKLSQQEKVNRLQQAELVRQKTLLDQYEGVFQLLRSKNLKSHSQLKMTRDKANLAHDLFPDLWNNLTDSDKPSRERLHNGDSNTLPPHEIFARSDDQSPLQTVVNQISQQVTGMMADIQTLKNVNDQQDQHLQDAHTSTFIHWGSSKCGDSSQLIYSGVVGGSWYLDSGAATNYLCMTLSPVTDQAFHHHSEYLALLYGGEFQTLDSHQNRDPVCSVCRSSFSTTVMIPGTNVCTQGWHLQYSGYIMAGYHKYPSGSQYICVDSRLESKFGGNDDRNGRLLDYTMARCGSLPCEPYVNNTVVTCAVCSK